MLSSCGRRSRSSDAEGFERAAESDGHAFAGRDRMRPAVMGARYFRDRSGLPRLLSLPGFGQEVAPWLSGLVAVASSGLFPQPLWISVCSERRQRERMATAARCQYVFMWMRVYVFAPAASVQLPASQLSAGCSPCARHEIEPCCAGREIGATYDKGP